MHSLLLLLVLVPASLLIDALALWIGARLVRSVHATWRRVMLLELILVVALVPLFVASEIIPASHVRIVSSLQTLIFNMVGLGIIWFLIQRGFALSVGKTAAVLGLRMCMNAVVDVLAITFVLHPLLLETFVAAGGSMSPTFAGWHREIVCTKCGGEVIVPLVPGRSGSASGSELVPGNVGICSRCRLVTSTIDVTGPNLGPDRVCVYKQARPKRWDIVIFRRPDAPYACRVVGLPGETVHVADGDLFINGQKFPVPAELAGQRYTSSSQAPIQYGSANNPCTLGPDEYFLLGDLSMIANDSRYRGPVKARDIIGVADLRYWPISRFALLR